VKTKSASFYAIVIKSAPSVVNIVQAADDVVAALAFNQNYIVKGLAKVTAAAPVSTFCVSANTIFFPPVLTLSAGTTEVGVPVKVEAKSRTLVP
jgi:hypothetical protein